MSEAPSTSEWFSRPVQSALVIVLLIVLLAVPISLIRGVILQRERARDEAIADISATWGGEQSVMGPRLVVPYRRPAPNDAAGVETGFASFLPSSLDVSGSVTAEARDRGLFTVPVYAARLHLRGDFAIPDRDVPGLDDADMTWDEAALVLEVTDPKAIGAGSGVRWDEVDLELLPGIPGGGSGRRGVHVPVVLPDTGSADFEITLDLRGAEALWFVPFARSTRVSLASNWADPSFSGAWLPAVRAVDGDGFTAEWEVPFLGRDYGQGWTTPTDPYEQILASRFGTRFISPVDHYRMSERSTKYAYLFLALTFGFLWLFDTLVEVRVHPIQYLFVGAAMCMFYLLELSLSEHIGFVGAYGVAALGVVALIASYARTVLDSSRRGALMAGATGVLYSYLFALLTLERYALLVGSLGLFSALATVMHLTRNVDWHRMPGPEASRS